VAAAVVDTIAAVAAVDIIAAAAAVDMIVAVAVADIIAAAVVVDMIVAAAVVVDTTAAADALRKDLAIAMTVSIIIHEMNVTIRAARAADITADPVQEETAIRAVTNSVPPDVHLHHSLNMKTTISEINSTYRKEARVCAPLFFVNAGAERMRTRSVVFQNSYSL
jgi:hypothetical protein